MQDKKKRVSLYFNLEDAEDRLIWQQLNTRKKSQYIKRLLLNDINKVAPTNIGEQHSIHKVQNDNSICIDTEEELDDFPDDID